MRNNYKTVSGFSCNSAYFIRQAEAWENCYKSIHQTLKNFVAKNPTYGSLEIIFEYAIPRFVNGKCINVKPYRADVVILSETQATILEYKSAKQVSDKDIKEDVNQLIKYINSLVNHHVEAKKMKIDGALLYSKRRDLDKYVNNYLVISTGKFGKKIVDLVNYKVTKHHDVDSWINSSYI